MADFDSSLPVRTENPGDIDINISDSVTPSQKLTVNADGSINTNFASGSAVEITDGTDTLAVNADGSLNAAVTATDLDIRDLTAAQDNVAISDGTDTLAINADGSINTNFAAGAQIEITDGTDTLAVNADGSLNAVVTATDLDIRDLSASQDNVAISDGTDTLAINADGSINTNFAAGAQIEITDGTDTLAVNADGSLNAVVTATDLDIRDLTSASDSVEVLQATHDNLNLNANLQVADTDVSAANPVPVIVSEDVPGTEIVSYNTSAAVAASASVNHDYTVSGGTAFTGEEIWASGSGKIKVEVLINGAASWTGFNSTAEPNVRIPLDRMAKAAAGQVIRITITNRDLAAQDVYSTLTGVEV